VLYYLWQQVEAGKVASQLLRVSDEF
jgi:hypothetical protein